MFGRKKTEEPQLETHPPRDGAKNRPTPRRKDQEAARRQPLVPTDRKAAKSRDREARRKAYQVQRQALQTGDERNLPARDKGPARRFIRDWVDSRRSLGEFLLPAMLIVLALTFLQPLMPSRAATINLVIFVLVYLLTAAAVIDTWWMWRKLKAALLAKFGDVQAGSVMYAVTRTFQMRRARLPRPQVAIGERPS